MLTMHKRFANDLPSDPGRWYRVVKVTVPSYHLELYDVIMDVMPVEAVFCLSLPEGSGPPLWSGWQEADDRLVQVCKEYAQIRACQDVTVFLTTLGPAEGR